MNRFRTWLMAAAAFLLMSGGSIAVVRADGFEAEDLIGFCGVTTSGPGQTSTSVMPERNVRGWNSSDVSVKASWFAWCSMRDPHSVAFTVSGAEIRSGDIEIPDKVGTHWTTGYRWDITHEGVTTIDYTLNDAAGNPASVRRVVTVRIDKTAPVVAVTGVRHGATYEVGAAPDAACTTQDSLSGVATRATIDVRGAAADGTGTLTATCRGGTDVAGNTAAPVSVTYAVVHPTAGGARASITTDKAEYRVGETVMVCFTVPGPGPITITDQLADGRRMVIIEWNDDGRGACFSGTVTPPTGRECLHLDYAGPAGTGSTETCFTVGS